MEKDVYWTNESLLNWQQSVQDGFSGPNQKGSAQT